MDSIRHIYAPDQREAIFEITYDRVNDTLCLMRGQCDQPEAVAALMGALHTPGVRYLNCVQMLPDSSLGDRVWALVTLSSVNIRTKPAHAAEFGTQGLMGTPLRVLEQHDGWYRVQTPDRYICWVDDDAIALKSAQQMQAWRAARRYIYTGYLGFVYLTPNDRGDRVSDLVLGSILEADPALRPTRHYLPVVLPDGRKGYVKEAEVADMAEWAVRETTPEGLERTARSMLGVPYLWGGTSVKGVDCSGMVKTAYFANGVVIARDASLQALTGERFAGSAWRDCRRGDLLFFGNPQSGRITHVGMYLAGGEFIHSSGRVKINNLDPEASDYVGYSCLAVSRILTRLDSTGIVRVADHPWYFNR